MILGKQTVRFSKLDENVDEKKLFETAHETILNVSGPAVCRICHSGECSGPFGDSDAGEPLITPCKCKGTMGLFHQSCLVKWLKSSDTRGCEICGYNYEIYCCSPSILSFIFKEDDGIEHRNFLKDLLIFLILSPSVFAITALCIFPWVNNLLTSPKPITFNNFDYDNFVLVIFAFLVLLGYSFWLLVTCSFHRNSIQAWKKHHLKVVSVKPYQHSEVYMFARDETTVCALQMDGTLPDLPENMYDKTVLAQSTPRIKGKTVLSKSLEAAPVLLNFRDYSSFSQ